MDDDALPTPPKYSEADLLAQAEAAAKMRAFVERSHKFDRPNAIIRELADLPQKDLTPRQKTQLAEAYAGVGRFNDAYKLSKDKQYKYIEDKLNGKVTKCNCKDFETVELIDGKVTPIKHSRFFVKRTVFDGEKFVGLQTCNVCGK